MTKEKLISFILKKQSYKQLRPTIIEIGKSNKESIKNSINAVQQILTKEYNAESKLYALRFLKDCFEMGSKNFIKQTEQNILPIITNIVIESTDEAAITRYAGSSFTKTTDLQKFKSIIVSFFKLSKECIMKWAQWIPNSEFKFKSTFLSLQKKGIKFQFDIKYFRPENQNNFIKNCRENGFQIQIVKEKDNNENKKVKSSEQPQNPKPITVSQNKPQPSKQQQKVLLQNIVVNEIKLGQRYGPKSNNKYILKCHQLFKQYDEKLKKGTITQNDIEVMKSQINSQLEEYMGLPDLNQTQMESQLTSIFENIKNLTDDFNKLKQNQSKVNLSLQNSQSKPKISTIKKTEPISNKKAQIQPPLSPISRLQTPRKSTPIGFPNDIKDNKGQVVGNQIKKQNAQPLPKMKETFSVKEQTKIQEKKKIQIFQDNNSILQNQNKQNPQISLKKQQKKQQKTSFSSSKKVQQQILNDSKNLLKVQMQIEKSIPIQKSGMKSSKKNGTRQYFDSNLEFSRTESSRVNFTQSSNDEDSNDQDNRMAINFKKQKAEFKLSSIAEQENQKFGETSRRNASETGQLSSVRQSRQSQVEKQKRIEDGKSPLQPSEIKVSRREIDEYESKIKALQQNLQAKQSKEKQLENKLNELNMFKSQQEKQLQKIRVQNNKIMERFANAVDERQYGKIKSDFDYLKSKNRKMEGQMDQLLKEIDELKKVQKDQLAQSQKSFKNDNKRNEVLQKAASPVKLFKSTQNLIKENIEKKPFEIQKPSFSYIPLDPDFVSRRTHLTKVHEFLDDNNLSLLKKNIIGASELFYNSEQISFICRKSPYKNEKLTLKLQLSFQFNFTRRNSLKPNISIPKIEEIEVWKKNIEGEQDLYNQEIVVKLRKFPFNLMKIEVQTSENLKKSVLLPFIYFSFLRKGEFRQEQFDKKYEQSKESIIKSKVLNLNSKVVKEFKSIHYYQGYSLPNQNKICFKLFQQSQNSAFWCELTSLSKQKCILKILPEPYTEQMYNKAEQLMQNLIFLIA